MGRVHNAARPAGPRRRAVTPTDYGILTAAMTLAATPVSWLLSRHSRASAALVIVLGLGLVASGGLLRSEPGVLVGFGVNHLILWFHGCLLAWGGLVLLGAALPHLRGRTQAATVAVFSMAMAVLLSSYPLRIAARAFQDLAGRPGVELCRQTTSWSCGPAAASTFLARMGVEKGEAEMASLCGTIPGRGTSDYGLWHGVRASLDPEEFDVQFVTSGGHSVASLPTPALMSLRFQRGPAHSVVLVKVGRRMATIADPSGNALLFLKREKLERQWRGSAVVVKRLRPTRITAAARRTAPLPPTYAARLGRAADHGPAKPRIAL